METSGVPAFLEAIGASNASAYESSGQCSEVPQYRFNPVSGVWSLHMATRDGKPYDYKLPPTPKVSTHLRPEILPEKDGFDPFDLSKCHLTPPEKAYALDPRDSSKKMVRVFDNKFAIFDNSRDLSACSGSVGLYPAMTAIGVSEVVVEHWKFGMCAALMDTEEIAILWRVIRDRANVLSKIPDARWVNVAENHGSKAGGSLQHPHAQVMALPFLPTDQSRLFDLARKFWKAESRNVFESLVDDLGDGLPGAGRKIYENAHCVSFVPWALEREFEFWVVPRIAGAAFKDASDEVVDAVADVLRHSLRMLYVTLDDPDYNILVRTGPISEEREEAEQWYRWHIVVLPSITEWAGVKAFGGFVLAPCLPEEMAAKLRASKDLPLSEAR